MVLSVVFVPTALVMGQKHSSMHWLTICALGYVFIYSFLPHKELRFIIYVFPILNNTAALGMLEM